MRQRWWGASGRRVPEIALEGDERIELAGALVVEDVDDVTRLREAYAQGRPIVVRASTPDEVKQALARPEVATVLVPAQASELLELDLTKLTYG